MLVLRGKLPRFDYFLNVDHFGAKTKVVFFVGSIFEADLSGRSEGAEPYQGKI